MPFMRPKADPLHEKLRYPNPMSAKVSIGFEAISPQTEQYTLYCRALSIIVLSKDGEYGVATNCDFPFVYASDECEAKYYLAQYIDGKTVIREIKEDECDLD